MQTWLNLQDKIIIVTGGASGIGLAIVEELLAQGANVQMVDIHGGDGQYEGHKGYQFWPTDISSAKEVNHTVAEIIQRFGRIDGLVNNAGVNFPRLLVDEKAPAGQYELNEAAFEKMVNINQKGVFLMSQAVARVFLFALRTGMRAGEICGLTWDRVHADHVSLPVTKTRPRLVPLDHFESEE